MIQFLKRIRAVGNPFRNPFRNWREITLRQVWRFVWFWAKALAIGAVVMWLWSVFEESIEQQKARERAGPQVGQILIIKPFNELGRVERIECSVRPCLYYILMKGGVERAITGDEIIRNAG